MGTSIVFGVSGKISCGKDEFAIQLSRVAKPGVRVVCLAFADEVKWEYAESAGLSDEDTKRLFDDKPFRSMHRQAMNAFSAKRREPNQDYFTQKVLDQVKKTGGNEIFVVKDCRLQRETLLLKMHCQRQGMPIKMVRMEADEATRRDRGWKPNEQTDTDAFETELDDYAFDYVVDNTGTVDDLAEVIKLMLP